MARSRNYEIRDVDGAVLFSAAAHTKRDLVQSLVRAGHSLARADLAALDLSNLGLEDADLRGARLDGTNLRGARLDRARLDGASLRPVVIDTRPGRKLRLHANLSGARLERASFDGADLTEAVAVEAIMGRARFRGAILDHADFTGAGAASCSFQHCRGKGTVFSRASLSNADFGGAVLRSPDFCGADLRHKAFGGASDSVRDSLSALLPNRTRGAVVAGGRYDDASKLCETVPAMRTDRFAGRALRASLWMGTTALTAAAADAGWETVRDFLSEFTSHAMGALGGIAVVGAGLVMKEGASEWCKERAQDLLQAAAHRVRDIVHAADRGVVRRLGLVVALGSHLTMAPLKLALQAVRPEKGEATVLGAAAFGSVGHMGEFVICSRRTLARALGVLASRNRPFGTQGDVTLARLDGPSPFPAPRLVRFMRDGRTSAVWRDKDGRAAVVRYGTDGQPEGCWDHAGLPSDVDALGLPAAASGRLEAILAMEGAVLDSCGAAGFDYDRETHEIAEGRHGAFIVRRLSDGVIDNAARGQPAMVRRDGAGIRVVHGSVKGEWVPARQPADDAQTPRFAAMG